MAKKRRGRNRKPGWRFRSGQRLEPKQWEDMRAVGVSARQRVYDLPRPLAVKPEAGDGIGRLSLSGEIQAPQLEAARLYLEIVRDYDRAMLAKPVTSSGDLSRQPGHDGSDGTDPAYVERVARAEDRYRRARRALLSTGDPLSQMVVDAIVLDDALDDATIWKYVGTLRVSLNALHHEFRAELLPDEVKAS